MFNGLIMGILFSANFLFSATSSVFTQLLSYVVMSAIIVLMYRMARKFRDQEMGGFIKYWQVFNFVVLTFLFAAIISAVFKMIYTQFIDRDFLSRIFEESMRQMEQNRSLFERFNVNMDDSYYEQLERQLRPASYAMQTIWVNILAGSILGLIIGGIVMRKRSIFDEEP